MSIKYVVWVTIEEQDDENDDYCSQEEIPVAEFDNEAAAQAFIGSIQYLRKKVEYD